jgi:hypothetical protein
MTTWADEQETTTTMTANIYRFRDGAEMTAFCAGLTRAGVTFTTTNTGYACLVTGY